MKILAIYDNGNKTFDRFTVVTDEPWDDHLLSMLGVSEDPDDPRGFSQWGGGQWIAGRNNTHLGKQIRFTDLSEPLQRHITMRVFGKDKKVEDIN